MNLSFGFSRAVENAQGPPRKTTFHVNHSMELLEIWVFFFVFFGRNKKKGMKAMGWGGLGWGGCGKWTARKLHNSFTECLAGVARVWRKRIGFESSQRVFFLGKKSRIFHPKISSDVRDFPKFHDFAHETNGGMAGKTLFPLMGRFGCVRFSPVKGFLPPF